MVRPMVDADIGKVELKTTSMTLHVNWRDKRVVGTGAGVLGFFVIEKLWQRDCDTVIAREILNSVRKQKIS